MAKHRRISVAWISNGLRVSAVARTAASIPVLAALAIVGLAGCSAQNPAPDFARSSSQSGAALYPLGANPVIAPHVEVASWYGSGFQGHPTSTGESFNEYGLTAASKTLPLGSTVRVTNPANGRSVNVRINDRGPYVRGRSLDLSKRAAQSLGITGTGVAPVLVASSEAAPIRIHYSPPHGVAARTYRPAHHTAEHSAMRWSRSSAHRQPVYRIVRTYHWRRHSRTVWNPVGAWIESSLSTL